MWFQVLISTYLVKRFVVAVRTAARQHTKRQLTKVIWAFAGLTGAN